MAAAAKDLNPDSSDPQPSIQGPLLLTGSDSVASENNIPQLQPGGPAVKLDDLGPLVVNSDGTLSRISNWAALTAAERANTIRVLSARNKLVAVYIHFGINRTNDMPGRIRLANEEQKLAGSTGGAELS
ncbi:hypothetical protein B0H12DRAFT_1013758 [Mycena haematopus]|nr:hypothetical protein B0H12DRAFT_1013758 [Mycena haematopus]